MRRCDRRGERVAHCWWPGGPSIALVSVLAALLLVACGGQGVGGSSSGSSSGEPVSLTCSVVRSPEGVDVIVTQLSCSVRNAPASDTAFVLRYSIIGPTRTPQPYGPTCSGALSNGSGSCSQRYSAPVPLAIGAVSVSGRTQPDGRALGPVTPVESSPPGTTPVTTPGLFTATPGGGAQSNGSMVVLTPASAGVTTTLQVGQVAQAQLPDARIWAYVGQTGVALPAIAPSGVRSAGLYLWTFRAQTAGSVTLRFIGKMACEASVPPCLPADISLNFTLNIVP